VAVRVLWVIKGLGPGGAERLLVAAASAHRPDAVALTCAYVMPWKDHLAEDLAQAGVDVTCLSSKRRDLRWPLRLARLVRHGGFEVVHVHSPLPGSVARLAARTTPRSRRPAVVATEHNRWRTHRLPTRLLNRLTSRWNQATFAVTDEVRHTMGGSAGKRAVTLQHGIDVPAVATARAHRAEVRAELGIADDIPVMATAANFRPQKDYPNLLAAVALLRDRGVRVHLVAVGQGPQEAEVRAECTRLGLDPLVTFTGFRADAVRVLGAADVFTLASQWEGLPVALMEALALGLPVVATAVGGVAEAMHNGDDALLVPPRDATALADALQRVLTDASLRQRLAAAAAARGPEFDVRVATDRLEHTYLTLSGHTNGTGAPGPATPPSVPPTPVSKARAMPTGLDLREATPGDRPAVLELCRAALGWGDDPRFEQLFRWKHDLNAFGPSYAWVATEGRRIVGLRMLMRWQFVRNGRVVHAVRAVDTATHPDFQGRGLFTAMTLAALDRCGADGVGFVFNTPNDKSRPGYLKMGWQVVGRLPAAVRPASPAAAVRMLRARVPAGHWSVGEPTGRSVEAWLDTVGTLPPAPQVGPEALVTHLTPEFVRWRYGLEPLGYRLLDAGDGTALAVRRRSRGPATELVMSGLLGIHTGAADEVASAALRPSGANHALRIGARNIRDGFVSLPGGGPVMTWRALGSKAMPPLPNWHLTMGDVELF
jgi:glycosyltransferase involved in cell wall biosynthesis/GNAT superfamily N-acetyltransferase